jgi:hypothetical protein
LHNGIVASEDHGELAALYMKLAEMELHLGYSPKYECNRCLINVEAGVQSRGSCTHTPYHRQQRLVAMRQQEEGLTNSEKGESPFGATAAFDVLPLPSFRGSVFHHAAPGASSLYGQKFSLFSHASLNLSPPASISSPPQQIKTGTRSRRLEQLAAALEGSAPPKKSRETVSQRNSACRPAAGADAPPEPTGSGAKVEEVSVEVEHLSLSKVPPVVLWIDKLLPKAIGDRQVQKDHICRTLARRKVEIDALFWHHSAKPQDVAKGGKGVGEVNLDRIKALLMSEKEFIEVVACMLHVSAPSNSMLEDDLKLATLQR